MEIYISCNEKYYYREIYIYIYIILDCIFIFNYYMMYGKKILVIRYMNERLINKDKLW